MAGLVGAALILALVTGPLDTLGTGPVVLGPGVLAAADPLVLETVEVNRVWHGWGLEKFASPGTVRVAVEDCDLLGWWGVIVTAEGEVLDCYVVDCQQKAHEPLSERGLVADVSRAELGHERAVLVLWQR